MDKTGNGCVSTHGDTPDLFNLLPDELIEIILYKLDRRDLDNLDLCSQRFNLLCSGNNIWKNLCSKRWPCTTTNTDECSAVTEWRKFFRTCSSEEQRVVTSLQQMSSKCYAHKEVSRHACADVITTIDASTLPRDFALQVLLRLLQETGRKQTMTEKYYTERVLKVCTKHKLRQDLERSLCSDTQSMPLETGALIIEYWCTLGVGLSDGLDVKRHVIDAALTRLYDATCVRLRGLTERQAGVGENDTKLWNIELEAMDHKTKLQELNTVLFEDEGFSGNRADYYHPDNSYITKVLQQKKGNPITLSVIYHALALRLGVMCHPVSFPSHFLLKFLEHPHLEGSQQYTYIDVFNGGRLLDADDCKTKLGPIPRALITDNAYKTASHRDVLHRMLRNLLHVAHHYTDHGRPSGLDFLLHVFELTDAIVPENSVKMHIARLYLNLNVNIEEIDALLSPISASDDVDLHGMVNFLIASAKEQIQENLKSSQVTPKLRSEFPSVKYSVGQVLKHKRYDYTCVIYGWDNECRAHTDWIYQMGVHLLTSKQWQPFYNVLVHDGTTRYAAQESLERTNAPHEISHPQVGKYFERFRGQHYQPNAELSAHYPEDTLCSLAPR